MARHTAGITASDVAVQECAPVRGLRNAQGSPTVVVCRTVSRSADGTACLVSVQGVRSRGQSPPPHIRRMVVLRLLGSKLKLYFRNYNLLGTTVVAFFSSSAEGCHLRSTARMVIAGQARSCRRRPPSSPHASPATPSPPPGGYGCSSPPGERSSPCPAPGCRSPEARPG